MKWDLEYSSQDMSFDAGYGPIQVVHNGQNGATFTPSVSDDGTLTWTNDRGLPNPEPANIKGPPGVPGATPVKGVDYFDGTPGASATHRWDGTTLTITSASGTSSANLKGDPGKDGAPGYTPVKGVDYFDGKDGYTPVKGVDYFDGEPGKDGEPGQPGKDGYTPIKGVDYFDGVDGKDGQDGYTPVKGKDYFDGQPGKDGVSVTHAWNGTTLTVTSASGTSSADLKGEKGDPGNNGLSAYQIAQKNGYEGTEAEWLESLQGKPGDPGQPGERGASVWRITTAPSAYTTATGGFTPAYRIALSTVLSQAGASDVRVGDTILRNYYTYPVGYVDASYVYLGKYASIRGSAGTPGVSVSSVEQTTASSADGGDNVVTVTLSDGTVSTFVVQNGSKGDPGATPQRGTDYWTPTDQQEIEAYIAAELAKRNQLAPEYAESVEWLGENGDQSKLYVLPDGMIYAWMMTETEVEGNGYTNLLPTATKGSDQATGWLEGKGYTEKARLSSSGSASTNYTGVAGMCASGYISAAPGDVLRIKNFSAPMGANSYVITYNGTTKVASQGLPQVNGEGKWATNDSTSAWLSVVGEQTRAGVSTITLDSTNFGASFTAIRFSGTIAEDTIVTVNQEIKEGGGTEIVKEYAWSTTGHAFVPADYEERIVAVEESVTNHTARIVALEKGMTSGGADETETDALARIRNWDSPIYDRVPVFQLAAENPAVTSAEKTVASIYAKYDALVAAHPNYITKKDLGVCSDGVTHVYRYDFCEAEPHHQSGMQWSETKPVVICASGIHWEWGGVYSLYYALKEIAENAELDDLRRNVHFVVVPIINPYCFTDIGAYSETQGVLNANGVQIHRNFEVGFIYPGQSGYQELGTRNHGGTEPLSEIETQNIDNIFKEFPDAALFLTCHSAQRDTRWGTGFIWASTATNYTCNLGYRLVDKMSKAWHKEYGTTWEEGCVRENNFVLSDTATYPNATPLAEGDYRAGHAHVSATDGTETRQATKYGIQGANVEVLDTFWVLSSTGLDSKLTTHGAEVYINYLLMYMGCYDHKDKKDYAPNLPWHE